MIWKIIIYLDKHLWRSWLKITRAKQKSKSIFTGIQQRKPTFSSRPNFNQTFLSGTLPGNKQGGSTSGRVWGFFFSRAASARGKDLPSSVSSAEYGNSQSRNILTHTSCNKRFISSKEGPKLSTGRSSPIFFRKLGETYKQPRHFEHSERIPDSLSVSAYSEVLSPPYLNGPSGKKFSGSGERTNVKGRCNKNCPTRSQSLPQLNICGAQKELQSSPGDKFEKSQSLHSVLPFQNWRVITLERNITGRGLHVQNRPQGWIFFSSTKFKISKLFKFQMEGSVLPLPLLLLWFRTCPKDIHEVDEIPISLLRNLYVRLTIFLDHILLLASSKEKLTLAGDTLIYLLQVFR